MFLFGGLELALYIALVLLIETIYTMKYIKHDTVLESFKICGEIFLPIPDLNTECIECLFELSG